MSETKGVKITLPRFSFLTAADLIPIKIKEDFEQLFNFQRPVISECTIVIYLLIEFNYASAQLSSDNTWLNVFSVFTTDHGHLGKVNVCLHGNSLPSFGLPRATLELVGDLTCLLQHRHGNVTLGELVGLALLLPEEEIRKESHVLDELMLTRLNQPSSFSSVRLSELLESKGELFIKR